MKLILRCILAVLTVIWVMNTDRVKAAENSPEQIDFAEHYINSGGTGEIVTVDFDWDGDKDVVRQVLDSPDGNFGFFWDENDGDQQFVTHELQIGDGNVSNISYNSFSVADIDGDGDYDLAAVGNKGGPTALLSWYENDGSNLNFFIHDIERTNALDTYFFWTIATVDFDKDGDMDVITSTYDSWFSGLEDRVILFSNDGAQSFTRLVVASGGWAAFNFAVEDFDNDNDNDLSVGIVSLSGEPNGFYWYGNEGSFPFTSHYIGEPAYSVIASKLNSDSFVDIVVEDTTGLVWYEGAGSGDFVLHPIELETGRRKFNFEKMINGGQTSSEGTLQTNDLDGDGDEEIISSKDPISNENMVLLYQNADGEGSFLPRQRLDSGGFLMNLETKIDDLDSDGMNDVIANGHTKLSWFENLTELPTIDLYGQDLTGTKVGLNQLEVNMDVLNGGNTPAGEFAVAFFVVRRDEENLAGAEVDKIGKKIGVVVIPSLEAGETHHISQTFRVRDLDLYKILGAIIDPANQISETDETNNRLRARMVGTGSQIYR